MVRTASSLGVSIVLLAGMLVPLLASEQAATPMVDLPDEFRLRLLNVTAEYDHEGWKNNPAFYTRGPVNGITERSGSFDRALGLHVTLRVELTNLEGVRAPPGLGIANVEVTANIETTQGPREAFVSRGAGTPGVSDSPEFFLNFDVDGSNYFVPPDTQGPAPLNAGGQIVKGTIHRRGVTGAVDRVGATDLLFYYVPPTQTITVSGLTAPYTMSVPDNMFRHFNDIGGGGTLFVNERVEGAQNINVSYIFGRTNATVRLYSLASFGRCDVGATPNPSQCQSPSVNVYRRMHATGTTDGQGRVEFTLKASDLLVYSGRSFPAATVVIAASLEPQADFPTPLPVGYSIGSPDLLVGATELVVPIGGTESKIVKYDIGTEVYENASRGPDPVQSAALAANALEVTVYDPSEASLDGTTYAITPGGAALASAPLARHQEPLFAKYRVSQVPVRDIQRAGIPNYRIISVLYNSNGDYSGFAWGDRGFLIEASADKFNIGQEGSLWLNLTSVNTNYDAQGGEADLALKVLLRIATTEPIKNETFTIVIPEGGTHVKEYKVSSNRVGSVRVTVVGTTGDTLTAPQGYDVEFVEPPPKKSFADRIPGFEVAALVLAGLVALHRRRR